MDTPTKSPSLAELQRWMRQVFTEPRGITAALENAPALLGSIADAPPLSPQDRLSVYSNAYFLRLLECLETDFPATRRALGKDRFIELAADYLRQHPSTSPNVSDLGYAFPRFLESHSLSHTFPFLPELARLEWGVLESMYSDRLPALNPLTLQSIPETAWPHARFTLDPTVRLFKVDWAIDTLWEKRREVEKTRGNQLPRKSPRHLLLYRDDEGLQLRVIDAPRAFALRRLQENASLERVCGELAQGFSKTEKLPVMEWFAHWVRAGVIKKIHVEE